MAILFDASPEAVDDFFPHTSVDAEKAKRHMERVSGWLAGRLGRTTFADLAVVGADVDQVRAALTQMAKGLVEIGAASLVEAGNQPELANPDDASAYASWLWARYTEGIDELLEALGRSTTGDGDGEGVVGAGEATHSFPEVPIFTRSMGV